MLRTFHCFYSVFIVWTEEGWGINPNAADKLAVDIGGFLTLAKAQNGKNLDMVGKLSR